MTVTIEKSGPVTTVIHSRPEARNAMDEESAEALTAAFLAFDRDPDAAVAVFWGAGGAFCAGWDLKLAASLAGKPEPLKALDFPDDGGPAPRGPMGPSRLELSKPVIAAVAGPAVAGGFELALWCDLRVMEEDAYFGVYCRRWGIPLIDGGTVRLPRLVGQGRALDIILTGRKVTAEEAYRIGACRAHRSEAPLARGRRGARARDRPLPASLRARRPALGLPCARAAGRRGAAQRMADLGPCPRRGGRRRRGAVLVRQGQGRGFRGDLSAMAEIHFYHLQRQPLEAVLPTLIEKSLGRGWRAVVQATSAERLAALDDHLWTFSDESFLAHATDKEPDAADQPVVLTLAESNPNRAAIRFLVEGAPLPAEVSGYERLVVVFDGNDEEALAAARGHWKAVKAAGHEATYWQQDPRGRWEKKG